MTLSEARSGDKVKVVSLLPDGLDSGLIAKMSALGFVPGAGVEVVRRAPFGRSLQLKIKGGSLCLTAQLADSVKVAQS
ncbi:FeoA family protein [Ferrimonas marina]|uniref:Ferrous iron transport protein A n=1 Tax=Ferrimonas marina TaxID=299255 RepID=A0A1M5YTZ3_9GAMM|nr:FeoA family protein [Ferrimonas marina]SHI15567.1 ferrous iron transport protein A [Ferrimonas marina]